MAGAHRSASWGFCWYSPLVCKHHRVVVRKPIQWWRLRGTGDGYCGARDWLRTERISIAPPRLVWPGATLIGFGWIYPHFLEGQAWWPHLYATPLGVVPCPTLATTIGISLVLGAFGSRAWAAVLAPAAIFYGAVGVFRLGVTIDIALFVGAMVLARVAVRVPAGKPTRPSHCNRRGSCIAVSGRIGLTLNTAQSRRNQG